jgi:DNA helicase HerA-like ATPase
MLFPVFEFLKTKPRAVQQKPVKPTKKKSGAPVPVLEIGQEVNTGHPFRIDSQKYLSSGERDAILASSGMGKSYLMGVIIEEILEKSNQVVFIIDPEGEWHTLKERYHSKDKAFLVMKNSGPTNLVFPPGASDEDISEIILAFQSRVSTMVSQMIAGGVSCVFDLNRYGTREQLAAYTVIAESIFKGENNLSDEDESSHACRKVRLVMDEAHVFAPQKGNNDFDGASLVVTEKIAKRGRKRNIHLLVATQRPQAINKNVLSQCNRFWLGGIQSKHDFDANKSYYIAAGLEKLEKVQALPPGHFVYSAGSERITIKARKRHCKHGGATKEESTKPILSAEEAEKLFMGG